MIQVRLKRTIKGTFVGGAYIVLYACAAPPRPTD